MKCEVRASRWGRPPVLVEETGNLNTALKKASELARCCDIEDASSIEVYMDGVKVSEYLVWENEDEGVEELI